jgi:hypothetical protein
MDNVDEKLGDADKAAETKAVENKAAYDAYVNFSSNALLEAAKVDEKLQEIIREAGPANDAAEKK